MQEVEHERSNVENKGWSYEMTQPGSLSSSDDDNTMSVSIIDKGKTVNCNYVLPTKKITISKSIGSDADRTTFVSLTDFDSNYKN